ncbi:MAG: response regulator transcription factor [Bacteroidetes bacterium]|nr:response regulator transcription factor [Bacteroidota bacterium]MBS1540510.1 response regulator transcription factor [Bacteroidota bacterium]
MSVQLKAIVVEDEPLAREGLLSYLEQIDFIQVIGVCEDALQANRLLAAEPIDLMFLDIQMPRITGIEFLKSLKQPPMVVMTTAYPNFALQGYELDVLDYLIKPFPFERLLKATNKARDFYLLKNKPTPQTAEFFFVKCDHRYEKILLRDVTHVEGMENYVVIHTPSQKFVTLMRMKTVEEMLPPPHFIRTHKSFIVAISAITSIDGGDLIVGGKHLPMSRDKKTEIVEQLLKEKKG